MLRRLLASGLIISFFVQGHVFADLLSLNATGQQAVGKKIIRGRIIILRDKADLPTLKFPGKYFLFELTGGGVRQLEWRWVLEARTHDIDTLDDLRAIFSNRDLQYGGWENAFRSLMLELDPGGSLGLKEKVPGPPDVVNQAVKPREGWLSRYFLYGQMTPAEQAAAVREARAKPPEDPLGYSLIDPLLGLLLSPENTMGSLIDAVARMETYGEPEKNLLTSVRTVAKLLCEDMYAREDIMADITVDLANRPEAAKEQRVYGFVGSARYALIRSIENGTVFDFNPGKTGNERFRYSPPEDPQPLDIFDIASAATKIAGDLRVPTNEDRVSIVGALLKVLSGPEDPAERKAPPAKFQQLQTLAGNTLVNLASINGPGGPERGRAFRLEILEQFSRAAHEEHEENEVKAVGDIFMKVGIGTVQEISPVVNALIYTALNNVYGPKGRMAAAMLKKLPKAPITENLRAPLQRYIASQIESFEIRKKGGTGGPYEVRFLELYYSSPS